MNYFCDGAYLSTARHCLFSTFLLKRVTNAERARVQCVTRVTLHDSPFCSSALIADTISPFVLMRAWHTRKEALYASRPNQATR